MAVHCSFAEYVKRDLIIISGRLPKAAWINIKVNMSGSRTDPEWKSTLMWQYPFGLKCMRATSIIKSMDGKLSGHQITLMRYFELNTLADHPLLKAIVSKRICDVKKIPNAAFLEYMQDYDKLVIQLAKMLKEYVSAVICSVCRTLKVRRILQ